MAQELEPLLFNHLGDLHQIPGSWFWPDAISIVAGIWKVN